MRRIRHFLLATTIGLMGSTGSLLAQGTTPQPLPGTPGAAAKPATPAQSAPSTPIQSAPVVLAPGSTGCCGGTIGGAAPCATDCGPTTGRSLLGNLGVGRTLGRIATAPLIGKGCENNVACGSLATERTFLFGSCRQFFNPGNKCGLRGGCSVGGAPLPHTGPCEYGSYLNR